MYERSTHNRARHAARGNSCTRSPAGHVASAPGGPAAAGWHEGPRGDLAAAADALQSLASQA
eukprot:4357055-Lingulodinium_polyedra.AAC.1